MAANIELKFAELDRLEKVGLDWSPPNYRELTPERKAHIVRVKTAIVQWLEKLHADLIADGLNNMPTPGLKVADGRRPPVKWRNPLVAQAYLEQKLPTMKVFKRVLITPNQAVQTLGKGVELPKALIERGEPKPILVPIEDARPRRASVDDKFDDENVTI